jgi:hypothetical protein
MPVWHSLKQSSTEHPAGGGSGSGSIHHGKVKISALAQRAFRCVRLQCGLPLAIAVDAMHTGCLRTTHMLRKERKYKRQRGIVGGAKHFPELFQSINVIRTRATPCFNMPS